MDYPDKTSMLKAQQQSAYNPGSLGTPQIQAPAGVSTAIQTLFSEVVEACQLGENLRSTLGISQPKSESTVGNESPSLRQSIVDMTYRLRAANSDLAAVLQHLNS